LYKVKENLDNVPVLEFINDFERADIKLYLTNELHPEVKIAFTRVGVERVTKEIVFVEMYGFERDRPIDSNVNAVALQHGIGYALGLSHTNYKRSVMFPRVISIDNVVIGVIGSCKEIVIMQIYAKGLLEQFSCKPGRMEPVKLS
jgi:hypothetical protein